VNQVFEKPVVRRGFLGVSWLSEAREHLRRHYPADGLAESCLWALHAIGFRLPAETRPAFPPPLDSDEDVMAPLRRVTSGGAP
jgi:hypothetical protein